jgi:hypothetical protein
MGSTFFLLYTLDRGLYRYEALGGYFGVWDNIDGVFDIVLGNL